VIVASEPLFQGNWQAFPENSMINVSKNLEVILTPIE
jgi:predicted glutamine amidotransferase